MRWLGWAVWLTDDKLNTTRTMGGFLVHDATQDRTLWRRYGTTRAARDKIIKAALAKAYDKEVSE